MRGPVLASLALHGLAVVLMAFTGAAPKPPKETVYAVDIVSPPANVLGEPVPEPLANQEPGPAAAEPAPPAPAAEPEPPAPEPEPAPPVPEKSAPKEPEKAPEPRKTPERPTPPRPTPPRPSPTPPRTTPSTPPRTTPSTPNRPPATRPGSGQSGTGTDANRTRGEGTRTGPATGRNPQANSPGGEGLTIHNEGEPCPVAGYCENVTRQVQRFFRPPAGSAGARAEVCFRIRRDGSVQDLEVRGLRGGGATFRLAVMEAPEAAGQRKAFGTLPAAFDPSRWKWCVELEPS